MKKKVESKDNQTASTPLLTQPAVIASMDDDKWFKKFQKSKAGKIMDLVYDVKILKAEYKNYTKLSFIASALMISAKGTKHEEDAINLINQIYPDYFSEG